MVHHYLFQAGENLMADRKKSDHCVCACVYACVCLTNVYWDSTNLHHPIWVYLFPFLALLSQSEALHLFQEADGNVVDLLMVEYSKGERLSGVLCRAMSDEEGAILQWGQRDQQITAIGLQDQYRSISINDSIVEKLICYVVLLYVIYNILVLEFLVIKKRKSINLTLCVCMWNSLFLIATEIKI